MGIQNSDLDRLLRGAAVIEEQPLSAPFGFATRVVAQWRASHGEPMGISLEFGQLLRRIAVGAAMVTAVASFAAYWQLGENEDAGEPFTNSYALADTAIESGVFQ